MKKINSFFIFYPLCCILIFLRLEIFYGSDVKAPFTDDFYYYLTTAKNFINLGYITFDKISITNGFQPLWFFFISFIFALSKNDLFFNSIIIFSIFLFTFFSYFNFKKYFLKNNYEERESNLIACLISFLTLFFSKNGMEISLAVFFFSLSLIYFNKNILVFCILSFLTFLSRLEFLIFYFLLLINELFLNKKILSKEYTIKLLLLPFLIIFYISINLYFYDIPFPESGIAKSLVHEIKFNKETFSFLTSNGYGMKFISAMFYFNCIGIFFLFSKKIKNFTKISLLASLLFFISNSLRSAWPLWTWHFFFLGISSSVLLNDFLNLFKFRFTKYSATFIGIFFVSVYFFLFIKNLNINNDHILNIADKIESHYANSKYETFAMGDMAGKVSYLLDKKLIQLEGLVGGKKVLRKIQNQENLCKLFKEFNVDIYLTTKINKIDELYYIEEPSQVSTNVKKMTGKLIIKPEINFKSANLNVYAFNLKDNKFCFNN
tara:strand:+ start:8719 stop:10191 length:1473 start_codon:yes stop_codon:yes gene_type:complete